MISLVPAAEPKSFMRQIQKIESLLVFNIRRRGQMHLDANVFLIAQGREIAEFASWRRRSRTPSTRRLMLCCEARRCAI